jgi:predicted NAD/FAD-binding protein
VHNRPGWRVIRGGSQCYVAPLIRGFRDRIRLRCPVRAITRMADGVRIVSAAGCAEWFDAVVIAAHSNQALAMLADPSRAEREILGALRYQPNEAVLHTDARLLPRNRRAWAAWNYHLPPVATDVVTVTYNMNILQGLEAPEPFCVTLNRSGEIDPAKVIARMTYEHPCYDHAVVAAQLRRAEISGVNHTYFCGAYWGFGFHEDGVCSGLAAVDDLQKYCHLPPTAPSARVNAA